MGHMYVYKHSSSPTIKLAIYTETKGMWLTFGAISFKVVEAEPLEHHNEQVAQHLARKYYPLSATTAADNIFKYFFIVFQRK